MLQKKNTTPVASSQGDDGETAFTDDRKEHRLTSGRPQRDDHRNWHRWDCSESWQRPLGSWGTYGSQSVGQRWHQTVERWTELSFCSASAWSEVWRTSSLDGAQEESTRVGVRPRKDNRFPLVSVVLWTHHHLSRSGQSWVESDRNCVERTSCCSGYSRGCCCHLEDIDRKSSSCTQFLRRKTLSFFNSTKKRAMHQFWHYWWVRQIQLHSEGNYTVWLIYLSFITANQN